MVSAPVRQLANINTLFHQLTFLVSQRLQEFVWGCMCWCMSYLTFKSMIFVTIVDNY